MLVHGATLRGSQTTAGQAIAGASPSGAGQRLVCGTTQLEPEAWVSARSCSPRPRAPRARQARGESVPGSQRRQFGAAPWRRVRGTRQRGRRSGRCPRIPRGATPEDRAGVRCGRAPSEEYAPVGQDSPVREEGPSRLEDADRVLREHERRRLVIQVRIHADEPGSDRLGRLSLK